MDRIRVSFTVAKADYGNTIFALDGLKIEDFSHTILREKPQPKIIDPSGAPFKPGKSTSAMGLWPRRPDKSGLSRLDHAILKALEQTREPTKNQVIQQMVARSDNFRGSGMYKRLNHLVALGHIKKLRVGIYQIATEQPTQAQSNEA